VSPSIGQLRHRARVQRLRDEYGDTAVVQALRDETDEMRRRLVAAERAGMPGDEPASAADAMEAIEARLEPRLRRMFASSLRTVVNATGVIIHTNLGRSPLSPEALAHVTEIGQRYSTLEYDLEAGGRGHRDAHAEALLCRLTGAEAAVVVNNCASATMLVLAALASGHEVIVSRGELVEIGGGFRVPDVMAQSGAILREVGTTNRTRAADYDAAVSDKTAFIMRVHRSNFRIEGFTETPTAEELVAVGRARQLPVVEDLGILQHREGRQPLVAVEIRPGEVEDLAGFLYRPSQPHNEGIAAARTQIAARRPKARLQVSADTGSPSPQSRQDYRELRAKQVK
jgi:L-seryl-tRNA(Ser) seleniumtransferase